VQCRTLFKNSLWLSPVWTGKFPRAHRSYRPGYYCPAPRPPESKRGGRRDRPTGVIRVGRPSGSIALESGAIGASRRAGRPLVGDDGLRSRCDLVGWEQVMGHNFDWASSAIGRILREAAQSFSHQTVPNAGGGQIPKIVDHVTPGIVEFSYGRHESDHASNI